MSQIITLTTSSLVMKSMREINPLPRDNKLLRTPLIVTHYVLLTKIHKTYSSMISSGVFTNNYLDNLVLGYGVNLLQSVSRWSVRAFSCCLHGMEEGDGSHDQTKSSNK